MTRLLFIPFLLAAVLFLFPSALFASDEHAPAPATTNQAAVTASSGEQRDGLPFVFAAYAIVWAAFFAYLVVLLRRERELRQEIRALHQSMRPRPDTEKPR